MRQFQSDNLLINSYQSQDDGDSPRDLYNENSEYISIEKNEYFNMIYEQVEENIIVTNDAKIIDKAIVKNTYQVVQHLKINDFSQQKICSNLNLYIQPKIDCGLKNFQSNKSRIKKKQISKRPKMNTN